jgi:phospholipid/cholesterol/gamma-HCH transport system permease protein
MSYVRARITRIGETVVAVASAAIELWLVYVSTIAGIVRGLSRRRGGRGRPKGEIWRQLFYIGNKSLIFIIVTLGFIGMVMTYQACLQLSRVTGDYSQVGPQFLRLIVSDFEQIDALRMSGVLPIDYLIVPRFIASVIMTLMLATLGAAVAYGAGGLTADFSFGVNPNIYFDLSLLRPRHFVLFVVKAVSYGAAIPIVAGFCGLRARGSSEGVGWATTAAVIGASFAVIELDFVISAAALFLTGGDL